MAFFSCRRSGKAPAALAVAEGAIRPTPAEAQRPGAEVHAGRGFVWLGGSAPFRDQAGGDGDGSLREAVVQV